MTKISELPSASALAAYIKRAMKLNEEGVKAPRATPKKRALTMPPDLAAALKKNRRAAAAFAAFSPSNQREYIEWLVEAKRDETRARRLSQAIEWNAEGKPRNWKYMNC